MFAEFRLKYKRQIILIFSALALLALTVLSAGLTRTEFRAVEHYVVATEEVVEEETGERQVPLLPESSGNELFILLLIATLGALVGLTTKEGRKRLSMAILWFSFMIFISYILSFRTEVEFESLLNPPEVPEVATDPLAVTDATEVPFEPPEPTSWVSYVVSFVIISALGVGGWYAWRWMQPPPPNTLHEIGYAAQLALDELESGADWQDAIINAYIKMGRIVTRQRGLQRPQGMTASEFANRLERAGLPADPVNRLTRLFESVRYGGHSASQDQINEATICLTTIVQACGAEL